MRRQTKKRNHFSEEQKIGILEGHQAGLSAKELCRKHEISDSTFYKGQSKYRGTEVSDARRLKMLAEQMPDVATRKEMLGKTSEVRFKETRRGQGDEREELFTALSLCACRFRILCVIDDFSWETRSAALSGK